MLRAAFPPTEGKQFQILTDDASRHLLATFIIYKQPTNNKHVNNKHSYVMVISAGYKVCLLFGLACLNQI